MGTTAAFEDGGLVVGEEIGRGGFAVVHRGRDTRFDREVAVKVLRTRLDGEGWARFERECAAVGAISDHPHVVAVHRSGVTVQGSAYLVMELLSGGSLADRSRAAPLAWPAAVGLAVALAGALETAHRAGVLHRDVKPENVLFSAFGAPVLVDFGIAAVRGGYETRSGLVTASLAHAAPEVVAGAPATAASDVYALASTVLHSLTGTAPFAAASDETLIPMIARIATAPPPDLRGLGVPDGVCSVLENALAKDPSARPASAEAFGMALRDEAARAGVEVAPVALPAPRPPEQEAAAPAGGDVQTRAVARRSVPVQDLPAPERPGPRLSRTVLAGGSFLLVLAGVSAWTWNGMRPARATSGLSVASSSPADDAGDRRREDPVQPSGPAVLLPAGAAARTAPPPTAGAGAGAVAGIQPGQDPAVRVGVPGRTTASPAPPAAAEPRARRTVPVSRRPTGGQEPTSANHAPSLAALPDQSSDELTQSLVRLDGSDPDGDRLRYTATGLPAGLAVAQDGRITGTISPSAASVTVDRRRGLVSRSFTVHVRVSDGVRSDSGAFTWSVRDTHRFMPDYFGKYGCDGDGTGCREPGVPHIASVSTPSSACTERGSGDTGRIMEQSVPAGAVIRWGAPVTYTYLSRSC